MKLLNRRSVEPTTEIYSTERKLEIIVCLIKDLSRSEYNRLRDGMDLIYNGYQKINNSRTSSEKEIDELNDLERAIDETTKTN